MPVIVEGESDVEGLVLRQIGDAQLERVKQRPQLGLRGSAIRSARIGSRSSNGTTSAKLGGSFWTDLVVPVLRKIDRPALDEKSGLARRTIERQLSGAVRPRENHEQLLVGLAVEYARNELADRGRVVPREPMGILQRLLSATTGDGARCGHCGRLLTSLEGRKAGAVMRGESETDASWR